MALLIGVEVTGTSIRGSHVDQPTDRSKIPSTVQLIALVSDRDRSMLVKIKASSAYSRDKFSTMHATSICHWRLWFVEELFSREFLFKFNSGYEWPYKKPHPERLRGHEIRWRINVWTGTLLHKDLPSEDYSATADRSRRMPVLVTEVVWSESSRFLSVEWTHGAGVLASSNGRENFVAACTQT